MIEGPLDYFIHSVEGVVGYTRLAALKCLDHDVRCYRRGEIFILQNVGLQHKNVAPIIIGPH